MLAAIAAAAIYACSDSTASTTLTTDRIPPSVAISKDTGADSLVSFLVGVKDNIGIKSVHVTVSGGVNRTFDTTFTSAKTDVLIPYAVLAAANIPRGTPVIVTASAMDGAGNLSPIATLSLTVGNLPPPSAKIINPKDGDFAVVGKSITVVVKGNALTKVRTLGYIASGVVTNGDSIRYSSPLMQDTTFQDTLAIPAAAAGGPLVLTPFLVDSAGFRFVGPPVTVTVQTAAQANSVPVVSFGITKRVEVGDTIHVEANDPAGITALGYEIRRTIGGTVDPGFGDSIALTGTLTSAIKTFTMRLPFTTFPDTVFVKAFAKNTLGTRAYAKLSNGVERVDTVIVVAGTTRGLPLGGQVADALYHPGRDRLYLTNILRNRVEIFDLADSSFKPAINVGSRPWGLAARPLNRSGAMTDTLLVANSGGTDVSYVAVSATGGSEVKRYALPNIIAYTVTTVKSPDGVFFQQRTAHDFSDRPQYLAATCKDVGAGNCGDVILVYTTTPTAGQSIPFTTRNGTLRWENLTQRKSHFFFEQAVGQTAGRSDTLEIVRYDATNPQDSTVLVQYRQPFGPPGDQGSISVVVDIARLGFRDTTFTRNSGNFRRAIVGEGGSVVGSRALMYDVNLGLQATAQTPSGATVPLTNPYYDNGVTGSANVSDFIANTFQTVTGVGINFDGSLGAVRGDSTYIVNPLLRLQGIFETTAGSGGVDFHPSNVGPNSFPTSTRLAFAASALPVIEIYDTYCYALVGTIAIRDPIIGPVKSALRPNGSLMLIGATAHGVVITQLPNTFTTSCP